METNSVKKNINAIYKMALSLRTSRIAAIIMCFCLLLATMIYMRKSNVDNVDEIVSESLHNTFSDSIMHAFNEERVDQEDPRLIQLIRNYYIDPPSEMAYNLKDPKAMGNSQGQSKFVDMHLNAKTNGFFVECGAYNGEWLSNSLFFEMARNWSGLLIEADPESYQMLKQKHRKAFSVNACLSTKPYPMKVTFSLADTIGRINNDDDQKKWVNSFQIKTKKTRQVHMQCFPLTSLLLALGRTKVDYFSLDIEGDELKVLKTIPMDKINIAMMSVEVPDKTPEEKALTSFMDGHRYKKSAQITTYYASDNMYIKT